MIQVGIVACRGGQFPITGGNSVVYDVKDVWVCATLRYWGAPEPSVSHQITCASEAAYRNDKPSPLVRNSLNRMACKLEPGTRRIRPLGRISHG